MCCIMSNVESEMRHTPWGYTEKLSPHPDTDIKMKPCSDGAPHVHTHTPRRPCPSVVTSIEYDKQAPLRHDKTITSVKADWNV